MPLRENLLRLEPMKYKTSLFLLSLFAVALMCALAAHAKDAPLPKGWEWTKKVYNPSAKPLCDALFTILKHPLNVKYQKKVEPTSFMVPEGFPDFSIPTWETAPESLWRSTLSERDQQYMVAGEPVKMLKVDIDHDGKKETMLQYPSNESSRSYWGEKYNMPRVPFDPMCQLADAKSAWMIRYNEVSNSPCFVFSYKNEDYVLEYGGYSLSVHIGTQEIKRSEGENIHGDKVITYPATGINLLCSYGFTKTATQKRR
jgi:hypothetical protein